MYTELDPKAILAKQKADNDLANKVNNNTINIRECLSKHRGRAFLLLKDGRLIDINIKLSTNTITIVDFCDGSPFVKINTDDIVDIDISK